MYRNSIITILTVIRIISRRAVFHVAVGAIHEVPELRDEGHVLRGRRARCDIM